MDWRQAGGNYKVKQAWPFPDALMYNNPYCIQVEFMYNAASIFKMHIS